MLHDADIEQQGSEVMTACEKLTELIAGKIGILGDREMGEVAGIEDPEFVK